MILQFEEIKIKKKIIVKKNNIEIGNCGVSLIKGKNGVGKTLLINKLFLKNFEQSILIGQDNNHIFKELNILENIAMSKDKEILNEISRFMRLNNIYYLKDLEPGRLSGGEKRIIILLRAFFSGKKIVFIDEPTNDLDYKMSNIVLEIIKKLSSTISFIIITHDDRFEEIADNIFLIENKELKIIKDNKLKKYVNDSIEKNIEIMKTTKEIVRKVTNRNFLIIFNIILLLMISIWGIKLISSLSEGKINLDNENQIEIFIPLSNINEGGITTGALPISIFNYEDVDDFNIFKLTSTISDKVKSSEKLPINFGLDIQSNKYFDVFNLEYYDSINKSYHYPIEIYMDRYLQENVTIDSKLKVNYYNYSNDEFIGLSKQLYNKTVYDIKNESKNNLENIFSIIYLKEITFWDFIKTEEFKNISNGNYYIKSNETIELVNQINSFLIYKTTLTVLLLATLLTVLLEFSLIILYLNANKYKIYSLRNYGIKYKIIKEIITSNYESKLIRIISSLIIIALNYYYNISNNISLRYIGNYSIAIYFILMMFILSKLNKKIIKIYVKKIYNWRYR